MNSNVNKFQDGILIGLGNPILDLEAKIERSLVDRYKLSDKFNYVKMSTLPMYVFVFKKRINSLFLVLTS